MNRLIFHPDAAAYLAVWSPERLALIITVVLLLMTVGVIVLCLAAFDRAIQGGKMPSKARGQFYGRVIGWLCLVLLMIGVAWYFDTTLFEKLSQISS